MELVGIDERAIYIEDKCANFIEHEPYDRMCPGAEPVKVFRSYQFVGAFQNGSIFLNFSHEQPSSDLARVDTHSPKRPTYQKPLWCIIWQARELVDHLPKLFENLAEVLKPPHSNPRESEVSHDARVHGKYRWRQGYRLEEVMREAGTVRRILFDRWLETFAREVPEFNGETREVAENVIHQAVSDIFTESAKQFVEEQQKRAEFITLTRPVEVKITYGKTTLPAGTQLRVVSRSSTGINAYYMGDTVVIPANSAATK